MNDVRMGVIGLGIMGSEHAADLQQGGVRRATLAAVCDALPANLERFGNVERFRDPGALIRSGLVDAVLIATPHYSHTTIGIDALKQGLHVMVEKPISVHKADAARLIAAHRNKKQIFGIMFNLRLSPLYRRLKTLVAAGEIGRFMRVQWTITDWLRSQHYYDSGGWRGTWRGEGGGILINQCPHQLDILQWICGMPSRVWGFCRFGARHAVEVEDEVTAYLEYPDGATGVFIASTGEAPGTDRLEIVGTRGRLVVEDERIVFTRNEIPSDVFIRTSKEKFSKPGVWNIDIPVPAGSTKHAIITQNFVDAILDGVPLLARGEEGINSVELANAMVFSTRLGKPVDLPLDGAAYERVLKRLIAESKLRGA